MPPVSAPTPRPRRRPTLDEAAAIDAVIRDAAIDTFLDHGFDGTSMDAVARAAGITRRTLYARYPDKRSMFSHVVHEALRNPPDEASVQIDVADLRGALAAIARSAHDRATDERTVRLSLLLMKEAPRFPELVPKEHHLTRLPHMQLLVDLLRHHARSGSIEVDDIELTAEHFLTMVASHPARLASFGLRRPQRVSDRYLAHAIDHFLRGIALTRGLTTHDG